MAACFKSMFNTANGSFANESASASSASFLNLILSLDTVIAVSIFALLRGLVISLLDKLCIIILRITPKRV